MHNWCLKSDALFLIFLTNIKQYLAFRSWILVHHTEMSFSKMSKVNDYITQLSCITVNSWTPYIYPYNSDTTLLYVVILGKTFILDRTGSRIYRNSVNTSTHCSVMQSHQFRVSCVQTSIMSALQNKSCYLSTRGIITTKYNSFYFGTREIITTFPQNKEDKQSLSED